MKYKEPPLKKGEIGLIEEDSLRRASAIPAFAFFLSAQEFFFFALDFSCKRLPQAFSKWVGGTARRVFCSLFKSKKMVVRGGNVSCQTGHHQ